MAKKDDFKAFVRKNPELINLYANLLYEKSLLIEGFKLEDPIKFANQMCDLMILASK